MKRISFTDIPAVRGALVILDIDGTLTTSGAREVSVPILQKVSMLARDNTIYLCSNKKLKARDAEVARFLQVKWIDTPYQKPSRRVLEHIPKEEKEGRPLIVIGDKILTDGLLAFAIGAHFFWVTRLREHRMSFVDTVYCIIDDVAARLFGRFF